MSYGDPPLSPPPPPPEKMHWALKALLIVVIGIPAVLLVLGALVFGICMLG
ncbi:MAG: hypothetical protein KDI71_12565 [Xanthomonadales bacterium]|nr:hypothetical protein [Xanthomonadales bacterium]